MSFLKSRVTNANFSCYSIEVCKPLGKVELLSMPYVTENRRVNIILPVRVDDRVDAVRFLEQYKTVCLEKKEKIFLVMVFNFFFIYLFMSSNQNILET